MNFGQGAGWVHGRHPSQKGIKNQVGDERVRRVIGVNRYAGPRNQRRPEFGRSDVGSLNDIGAEIRTGQVRIRVARQQPFMQQIFVEVGAHQAGRQPAVRSQVADWHPGEPGGRIGRKLVQGVGVTGGGADAVAAKDDDLLKHGAVIRCISRLCQHRPLHGDGEQQTGQNRLKETSGNLSPALG